MVGAAGFEPAALWSQTRCATKLRYTPIKIIYIFGRGDRTRTYGTRFWRPLLYQLSYTPKILWRRRRDLNPRASYPTYSLSRGASSATWVLLHEIGGGGGIRTHVALTPNGFQDRLVMTASIPLQNGDPSATRTRDTLIKSQMLYQLS